MARVQVRVGDLRLSPERSEGPDPFKLASQIEEFGESTEGMPAIQVTRGAGDEMVINDGVTRAARLYWLDPTATTGAEVIAMTDWDLRGLPRVREVVIPR